MLWKCASVLVVAAALYLGYFLSSKPDFATPKIPEDGYFGAGKTHADDKALRKFEIKISQADIDDLQSRIKAGLNRHFKPLEDSRFHDGFNPDAMQQVAQYWLERYDWKQHENYLNRFDHFKTEIEGIQIHYIRSKSLGDTYKKSIPILMVHGWPGSVWEFHKILPLLSHPSRHDMPADFAFEVICPSLPGFGWSEASSKNGMSYIATARIYGKLMDRLGFSSYYVQGGDWGSIVVTTMAALYPQHVKGLHINMPFVAPPTFAPVLIKQLIASYFPSFVVDTEDIARLKPIKKFILDLLQESGYYHIQATKPNTIGIALNDSPLGLAAWILEKFSSATNMDFRNEHDGGLTKHFTLDDLLTNVMIYWFTNTGGTSARYYKEAILDPLNQEMQKASIHVPTGIALFPHEPLTSPRAFLEHKFKNITRFTRMPRGGHFAALQEPKLLAGDLFDFVSQIERK